jgi:hypothetical protein
MKVSNVEVVLDHTWNEGCGQASIQRWKPRAVIHRALRQSTIAAGRKARILPTYRAQLATLVAAEPNLTLAQSRERLAMTCTVPAVHYALVAPGADIKKHFTPPSKAGPMWPKRAASGGPARVNSPRADSSSSTNRRRKRT